MEENPYQSPSTPPIPREPHPNLKPRAVWRAGAIAVLFILTVPAAFICGGITCYTVGVMGEASATTLGYERNSDLREAGWFIGIPIGLVVIVAVMAIVGFACWRYARR